MIQNNSDKSINYCLILAILWTFVSFYASTMSIQSVKTIPIIFEGMDKIVHIVLYFVFSFLWVHVFYKYHPKNAKWYVFSFTITFGLVMEIIQYYFFLDRFFEIPDIIANIIGSIIGVTLLNRIKFFKLC